MESLTNVIIQVTRQPGTNLVVLDVPGASITAGQGLIIYLGDKRKSNQRWNFEPSGEDPYYFIVNQNSGLVLDAPRESSAQVIQWNGQGNDSQKWKLNPSDPALNSGDGHQIINKQSSLVLDVQDGNLNDGTPVILYQAHDGTNQSWTFYDS